MQVLAPALKSQSAVIYSDGTESEHYSYNHLGQLTEVRDAAGTRRISYNRYGEPESDELTTGGTTHRLSEQRDTLGRSTGYTYAKDGVVQQQTTIGYGADGRIASAGFLHGGKEKTFRYSYIPGTHLLHTLTHPNGLTLTQSYEPARDLLTQMAYTRGAGEENIVRRRYTYDILGRPTARGLVRYGTETEDTFAYNTRSELTSARVNSADYAYSYDAVGNRAAAVENGTTTAYTANRLNQYTAEGDFRPTYDADGNQTLIKTSTGTWRVTYNAKNRPIRFEKSDGSVVAECRYDSMGRRVTKKVTTNGTVTEHRRFLYRGYLQIAACDLLRPNCPVQWHILWDPAQPTATRPLAIRMNRTWYTYGWDLTKNICELYRTDGRPANTYTYTPYGAITPAHADAQPLLWSSEYHDAELGLVYYNYRHYNPTSGRWTGRDMLLQTNLYVYCHNCTQKCYDGLGLAFFHAYSDAPLQNILQSYGVIAYTGPSEYILRDAQTKKASGLFKQLGIEVTKTFSYSECAIFGPSFDMKIKTLLPSDLSYMSDDAKQKLFQHEENRVFVYKEIYNKILSPVSMINIDIRGLRINVKAYSDDVMRDLKRRIRDYAAAELGNNSVGGINEDNKIAVWYNEQIGRNVPTTEALSLLNNDFEQFRNNFAFGGFSGAMYEPKASPVFTVRGIEKYVLN